MFEDSKILLGYMNSIYYTVFGTLINVGLTLIAAYPLSRADLPGQGFFMKIFTFTMIFGGGMIPNYILVKGVMIGSIKG